MHQKLIPLLFGLVLVLAACGEATPAGGGDSTTTAAPATTVAPGTTVAPATTAPGTTSPATTATTTPADDEGHVEGDAHDDAPPEDDGHMDDGHMDEGTHSGEMLESIDREVELVLTEFAFSPDPVTVSSGEAIRFVLRNDGAIEHEFRLTTQHAAEEHIAAGHEGHGDEAESTDGGHGHGEVVVLVPAGETRTVDVKFDSDVDFSIVACLIPGHFEAGMVADLTIEP